jgi:hypothetical protein
MTMRRFTIALAASALALGSAAAAQESDEDAALLRVLAGESWMQGEELEAALTEADAYPLGSRENPVRAHRPQGQRAYLGRLRCPGGDAPDFNRSGNLGPGVYGNIVDLYVLTCDDGTTAEVVMDMYHSGHVEERAVPGFTIRN